MHDFAFTRRRLRRTVWVTLLAWFLALSAGVVNACALGSAGAVVQATAQGMASAGGSHSPARPTHAGHGAHPGGDHQHEHDQGQAGGCQKFCDDESSAVTKSSSAGQDVGAALAIVVEVRDPVVASPSLASRRWLDRPFADGPPLVIRFLRLTL